MTEQQTTTTGPLPREDAARLGVLADSLDRFDLMRAITRCDELARELRAIQLVHSQNLCRIANRAVYANPDYCVCCDVHGYPDRDPGAECPRCGHTYAQHGD